MCKLEGRAPIQSEMPIGIDDFPPLVRDSMEMYNRLGDRHVSTPVGLLYQGKEYGLFDTLLELYRIHPDDKELVLDIIQHLDYKAVKKSSDALTRASKKAASA